MDVAGDRSSTPGSPPGYPSLFEADVVLSDGGTVLIRPIRPDDGPALARFHSGLSAESVYLRYFSPHPRLSDAEITFLTTVDYRWRMALVAVLRDEIVGVARYEGKEGTTDAEVAFLVNDAHHGRGIGTVLLEWLAAAAREAGITEFYASTLAENQKMLTVFRQAGFETTSVAGRGEVSVRFPVADSYGLAVAVACREHRAEARSVGRLLARHRRRAGAFAAVVPPAVRLPRLPRPPTSPPSRTSSCGSRSSASSYPRWRRWTSTPSSPDPKGSWPSTGGSGWTPTTKRHPERDLRRLR